MKQSPTKAAALAGVQALIAGTQKRTPTGSLTFGNATYAVVDLLALLQSVVVAMTALNAAQAGARDAMSALREVMTKAGPVIRGYRRYLRALYGNATANLADYGMEPEKSPTPLTSEEQAAKVQKALETRKLRGTKGRKQKARIKASDTAAEPSVAAAAPPSPPSTTKG
ncbi:MAG TPA: hypothetical protein VF765_36540 [Polyangiaceae bacterium]